jgi:Sulfotransferase family
MNAAIQYPQNTPQVATQPMRPLFVLSICRSGSSLLYALLNQHSQISLLYEGNLPILGPLLRRYLGKGNWTERWEFWNQAVSRHRISVESIPANVPDVCEATRIIYQDVARRKQATIWGEKSPHWYDCALEIAEKFPDACFIFLWRDIHGVMRSIACAAVNDRFFRKAGFAKRAYLGNERLRQAYVTLKTQGRLVHELNYEDLTSNPSECMKQICRFLEVPFEENVATLQGADRSAISQGEHHTMVRSNRIDAKRKQPEILPPHTIAKVRRYICRWKERSDGAWPKFPKEIPAGTQPPSKIEYMWDWMVYRTVEFGDKLIQVAYAILPLPLLRLWRSRNRSQVSQSTGPAEAIS